MKRIISILLSVIMVIVGISFSANAETASSIKVGDSVEFGSYYQTSDGNGGFKKEKIKWDVLKVENGKALLLSSKIIDAARYNSTSATVNGYYGNNYAHSEVRNWLIADFYNSAFNSSEKDCIFETKLDNSATSTTYSSESTNDKVFLLSKGEIDSLAGKYLNKSVTDYALSKGFVQITSTERCNSWLTRTAGSKSYQIYTVQIRWGSWTTYYNWEDDYITVKMGACPAIWVDINKLSSLHQWYFDELETALKCSNCEKAYYLSSNKNFRFNKDNFSFRHKDVGSYDISETGLKYINPILKYDIAALGINKLSHGVNYIINKIDNTGYGTWGGSCYGISCMDASFSSNLDTSRYGGNSVFELPLNTKLKDSINIMMYSQASILSLGNKAGQIFSNKNKDAVSAAKIISLNSYLPVLCYQGSAGGHAVNIIGILPDDYDPNYYVLTIYDCNSVDKPKFIIISKDYEKAYLGDFDFNNSDTPINCSSGEIDIKTVITGEQNSIDFWAPGLSTSNSYASIKKKAILKSNNTEAGYYQLYRFSIYRRLFYI